MMSAMKFPRRQKHRLNIMAVMIEWTGAWTPSCSSNAHKHLGADKTVRPFISDEEKGRMERAVY